MFAAHHISLVNHRLTSQSFSEYHQQLKMATTTPADVFPSGVKPLAERKFPKTLVMFDVDGTLTPARQSASKEMLAALKKLREHTATAFVGGSDLPKIVEQLQAPGEDG